MGLITAISIGIGSTFAAAVSRLLADEGRAWLPHWTERLVKRAVSRLPLEQQKRFAEEWRAHLDEVPGDIGKLVSAVSLQRLESTIHFKYVIDILVAHFLLLIVGPTMIAFAIYIKMKSRGPVFIRRRLDYAQGRSMYLYMFRPTSLSQAELSAFFDNVDKVNRITNEELSFLYQGTLFGSLLIRTGLYQTSLLINVIKGDLPLKSVIDLEVILRYLKRLTRE